MEIEKKCQTFLKRLGLTIRGLRNAKGWTLEQTEDHGWVSWRHLQKIESGKNITVATLWRVGKLYKVHPAEILRLVDQ